jgi:hypothetical protein
MARILVAVTQQGLVQLADMVLGETHVGVGLEHEVHRSAYPATSCSSRVSKDFVEIARESRSSTSASDSFAPSMRVEEPMLSIVATLRSALRRSGESVLRASHLPLNSSISAMSFTSSGPSANLGSRITGAPSYLIPHPVIPDYTRFSTSFLRPPGREESGLAAT